MKQLIFIFTLALLAPRAFAAQPIEPFQARWAVANYELQGDAQAMAFEKLIDEIGRATEASPDNAPLLIWQAIIESTYAGKTSGLSALGLVKSARASLEKAIEIDAAALDGSAYTSLGALYYQVPPWPIAFGSNKKARKFLERALTLNPDGIDSNYFYGAFLYEEDEYDKAKKALSKALQAADRPGRDLADSGRRQEIRELLQRIAEKQGA